MVLRFYFIKKFSRSLRLFDCILSSTRRCDDAERFATVESTMQFLAPYEQRAIVIRCRARPTRHRTAKSSLSKSKTRINRTELHIKCPEIMYGWAASTKNPIEEFTQLYPKPKSPSRLDPPRCHYIRHNVSASSSILLKAAMEMSINRKKRNIPPT